MSDREISPEARQIVAAAFAFAGQYDQRHEARWRARLTEGVKRAAAAMTGPPAWVAQEMLDAFVFRATYHGYDFEETSKRLVVVMSSDTGSTRAKDDDGFERARTDRTDTPSGKLMRERLDGLEVGTQILVWKVMETTATGDKARVFKHFEWLAPPKESQDRRSGAVAAGAPSNDASVPPPDASAGGRGSAAPTPGADAQIAKLMDELTNTQKIAVRRLCVSAGVENFMAPDGPAQRRVVEQAIEHVTKEPA